MASRIHIPRLTLFSGPNCSLCDVRLSKTHSIELIKILCYQTAKAELAKVRQSVCLPLPHRVISPTILTLQRPFQLETINIQEKGQERWKNKYVYWIPALRLEGKEIAKGRWDAAIVEQALAQWDQDQAQSQATTEAELPTK